MALTLQQRLNSLSTDIAKINYLQRIYSPGNTEVANLILRLNPSDEYISGLSNESIIKEELNHAQKTKSKNNLIHFAKKYIDLELKADQVAQIIGEKVIELGNSEIADYAYNKIMSKEVTKPSYFEVAIEIARKLKNKDKEKRALQKYLEYVKDNFSKDSAAEAFLNKKQYRQSLDMYLHLADDSREDIYGADYLSTAMDIAREHVPSRLKEVARKGLRVVEGMEGVYLESAIVLRKTKEAKKTLTTLAQSRPADKNYSCYIQLVDSLLRLGLRANAASLMKRVSEYQSALKEKKSKKYDFSEQNDFARLYEKVGDRNSIRDAYLSYIDGAIKAEWESSMYEEAISQGFKLTKDKKFLERKLSVLEENEDYSEAAKLARKLGMPERAAAYLEMEKSR